MEEATVNHHERIVRDPAVCAGQPVIKGTRVLVTSTFDNSVRNKFNPDPSKAVRWGEPTYDEMMIAFISYTSLHQADTSATKGR